MVSLPEAAGPALARRGWRDWRVGASGIALACSLAWMPWGDLRADLSDRIVAVVDAGTVSDKPVKPRAITASDVEEVARPMLARIGKEGGQVDPEKIRKRVLEELIQRVLREQKAEQMGLMVDEKDVDAVMGQVERNNNLPPGALPGALARQGIDLEGYRQGLRDQLLKGRLINKVIRPLVSVSPEEIQGVHRASQGAEGPQEVRLGQILLAVDSTASSSRIEEKGQQAEKLAEQLRQGASLATLAGQHSDDPSGIEGGEIGWFKQGELMPEMEAAVFSMKPGEVANPIRTPQGFHVVVLLEKRQGHSKAPVAKELTKVKARHILIKVSSDAGAAEERRGLETILKIRKELQNGADFSTLARKHSQDETAASGGDLQWFGPGMMVAPFEQAAFRMKPKEVSEPVRTPFGWHLILVEDKKSLAPDSLEAQGKELEERVMEAKLQTRYNQWLRDLRLRAFVEYR
ncbi:MAG: peptidylprolyl isomerase [Magnetococcales bacterium]|nr:peptidylprolyl isomerase [Magnetococcales bacterium]